MIDRDTFYLILGIAVGTEGILLLVGLLFAWATRRIARRRR